MHFGKIINKQRELNEAIKKTHNLVLIDNVFEKQILALYVEIAELANELQDFKYWKKTKNISREKILEEYSDGIHFFLSFGLDLKMPLMIEPLVLFADDINKQFLAVFQALNNFNEFRNIETFLKSFSLYLGIAIVKEFSDEEIENYYFQKNAINFERIKNNY